MLKYSLLRIPLLREFIIDNIKSDIEKKINSNFDEAIPIVTSIWESGRGVFGSLYQSHYDDRQAFEYELVEKIINNIDIDKLNFFKSLLDHTAPQLICYGLLGLASIDKKLLDNLPEKILYNKSKITLLSIVRENLTVKEFILKVRDEIV